MDIIAILTDRGRHSRSLKNSNFPSDLSQSDIWEDVINEAQRKGLVVGLDDGYVNLRKNNGSYGNFANNSGGVALAWEFLEA